MSLPLRVRAAASPSSAPVGTRSDLREIGRFLLTGGDPDVAEYWFRALHVPHGRRDRLARRILGALPAAFRRPVLARALGRRVSLARPAPRPMPWPPDPAATAGFAESRRRQTELLRRALDDADVLLRGTLLGAWPAHRWIALRDYDRDSRMRLVIFAFAEGADRPTAVLKLRPLGRPGRSLETEWRALHAVDGVAERLEGAVPAPLAYRVRDGIEMLLLSTVPGRSVDVDLRGALRPHRRLPEHFTRAAEWLASFHAATRWPDRPEDAGLPPAERAVALRRLAPLGPSAGVELARLEARAGRVPMAAAHGDFWARNVLVTDAGGVGVVDWERFRPVAPRHIDLFQFPIAYGRACVAAHDGSAVDPVTAFRRTFLEDGPLARAVADYLARYCERSRVDPTELRPLLALHLLTRESPRGLRSGPDAWAVCYHLLAEVRRPPFLP